jgi:hypothetical protein
VLAQQLRRLWFQLDRPVAQVLLQPGLAVARTVDRDVDDLPRCRDRLDQRGGNGAAATDENEHRGREGIFDHLDQPRHLGREKPAGVAYDHDALVDQERGRETGVDNRPHVDVVACSPTDFFDDERVIALAHHLG